MQKVIASMLLGASLSVLPALAMAQDNTGNPPTANGAAAQQGKPPSSAAEGPNGEHVDPSKKLWSNPRTIDEQPGTQPPSNDGKQPAHPVKEYHPRHDYDHGPHGKKSGVIESPSETMPGNNQPSSTHLLENHAPQ
ncbi:hypothetical protein CSR02_01580 [Acetobacter pomorum]|uniref:Uncharacterized protein n=1 Tax=Acetobacter pomorum TaxID=65959 RepID=A0A2G4RFK2_9PROT|nr:hypothetical protein [Acetobacter pomorum]KDE19981.1 hypothetical protein AZ09_08885 [Acetobacter aceti 1023]PHY95344.1 hypothetical protein CSR02_01580 [Acetobacter pomorum]